MNDVSNQKYADAKDYAHKCTAFAIGTTTYARKSPSLHKYNGALSAHIKAKEAHDAALGLLDGNLPDYEKLKQQHSHFSDNHRKTLESLKKNLIAARSLGLY